MPAKITQTEFEKLCQDKHGNKFKYLSEYKGYDKPITIECSLHGSFNSTLRIHLNGNGGCPKCAGNVKFSTSDFIEKSKSIYGDKFSYDKTYYINVNSKVIITCPEHGDFEQYVKPHLKGSGCTKCSNRAKHDADSFAESANKIHKNFYSYDKTVYGKNNKQSVTITCPVHGDFVQRANDHLSGKGCTQCANDKHCSYAVMEIREYLTLNNIQYIEEKTFDDCKHINHLRFDFYLPTYNLCIEYDGKQHFESTPSWGGEDALTLIKKRDQIKNDYCSNTGIDLLRIKYTENHIEKIKRYLK